MNNEEKYQALWSFLCNNGRIKTPNVYLRAGDGWCEREVCEMWVEPRYRDEIVYRTPCCHRIDGYHLFYNDLRHVENAAYIYDQLREDGLLKPIDKNLF